MTAVGTSVATNAASILSTLGDGGATRSSGAGSSVDGGFEALFSRTIEADDSPVVAGDRAEMAVAPLDRRAGSDRQRDAVADDRLPTRADDPADRVADPSDRATRAEAANELDDIDRPTRPRAASDSNDPSAVAVPLVIVAPLAVQTLTASPSVTPSLVPVTDAATPTVEAASAQPGAITETVAPIAPGAPGATMATAGTPTDPAAATGVPAAAADASPTTIESLATAVDEQGATSLAAAVKPMSSDATVGLPSSAAPAIAAVDASLADAMSSSAGPSSPGPSSPAPIADSAMSAMSGVVPQMTAQATAQAVGAADVALDAGGVESARSAASPATTAVDSPSSSTTTTGSGTGSGSGSGIGTAAPGTGSASGTGAPTESRATTTATPERVTELRRMRDRAALGGVAGGAMSVDLSDEGLGPLTLHALQSASGVHLTLEAADQATRDLLTSQGRALRNELEAGGTALGSLDIQHSGPGSSGERGTGTPSGRIDRAGATRSPLGASATTPLATIRPRPTPSADGVDLLI
jgi:hypothetical protein